MPILTYIARFTDGLLLVASTEHSGGESYPDLDKFKRQAKIILKRLSHHSELELSLTSEVHLCPRGRADTPGHTLFKA
jgi:hypothetical protein